MGKTKAGIQKPRPKDIIRKGLPESFPTSVQKSYFMLTDAERNVLNIGLQKYRPGQSEPILIGGEKLLKPALRLMSDYRLRIDAIEGTEVVTSYTRWLASVEARGSENREVYVTFSPFLRGSAVFDGDAVGKIEGIVSVKGWAKLSAWPPVKG